LSISDFHHSLVADRAKLNQLAICNWKSKISLEWLADPGRSPSGSNADLKPRAVRAYLQRRSESYA